MRTDKYMMAKAWMKQDQAPQAEALETWNTLEAEFNEERKAMLMANAESDKIKAMMNEKYGPGTVKYGSEIKQPEIKTPQAIFEFSQRNPAAEGGRMEFGDGGITEGKKANKGTFYLRIPNEDGVRIAHSGTKFQMEQVLKKYKERLKVKKIPSNRLTKDQLKIVLEWGKNKSKALGETWSDKKTLKEYNNLKEAMRTKVKTERVTGTGGSWSEGQIKPLTTEQQKLWDATMADEFGEWEEYPAKDRNRWRNDFPRRQKIYSQTKDLLNIDELAEYLGKEFNTDISRNKIRGSFGANNRTALGQYIRDNLFVDSFGSTKGKIEGEVRGNVTYYKKPTETQIDQIKKQNLVFDTRTNTLRPKTLKNIKTLNEMYGDAYRSGNIPKIKDMIDATGLSGGEIAKAEQKLAQIYNGHKFRNGPTDIRVNKNTANKLFDFMSKAQFGDPRKSELYDISLDLIDEGLGNEKNTFYNLKKKATNILTKNGIKVHSTGSPIGFNIDEFAGVTGSGRSKSMAASQFINIMEGNLNTKTLQNFQGQLSKSRKAVEAAKGTSSYNKVLKEQMETINTRAANLEAEHGIKLARLERPADINNMSKDEVKRLKNIRLGTDENLYQRLVKDAKASGYSIKVPEGSLTIQEFTDPNNKRARELIALVGCPNFKGKQAFSEGGRTGFSEGGDCFDKGQKLINSGMDGASKASMRNFSNVANRLFKMGAAVTKYGIIPEAVLIAADTAIRMDLGDTFEEGLLRAADYLTPDSIFGDFNQKADLLKVDRTFSPEMKKIVAQSFGYNNQLEKIKSLKNEKKNLELMSGDGGAFDEIGNLETKYVDERIKKAESDLKTKYTKTGQESIDFYANSILDEAYDKSMANSKYSKRRLKDQTDGFSSFGLDDYLDEESGTLFPRQKTQTELNKDLNVNRRILTGSPSEKRFMDLSTMPTGPRQGSEMDNFVTKANEYHKSIGSGIKVNSDLMRLMQEAKKEEKNMSIADMVKIYGAEAILGTQGNQGQPIKQKPMYDYAEGGITGLRSKYEYKK